jgi:hypothetical protein
MSRTIIHVALVAAWLAIPPAVRAQAGGTSYSGDPAKAQVLATKYHADPQRVLGMRRQFKMEWPEIEQALIVAGAVTNEADQSITMDAALNRVLELRAMGQEWGDIAQQFGATLPMASTSAQPAAGTSASKAKKAAKTKITPVVREPSISVGDKSTDINPRKRLSR